MAHACHSQMDALPGGGVIGRVIGCPSSRLNCKGSHQGGREAKLWGKGWGNGNRIEIVGIAPWSKTSCTPSSPVRHCHVGWGSVRGSVAIRIPLPE